MTPLCVSGGVAARPCPYECVASKYSLPHCNTPIEDLVQSFGGPLTFGLLNAAVLVLLAVTLSVARVRIAGTWEAEEPPSPKTPDAMHINQSHPFLESLNEVRRCLLIFGHGHL